ncbi:MAG TPA: hypothetical protein DDZ42_21900, partial [Candidatus Rokubacteria bacterium]|nr:hypothetical protein [Candidatus Rokubacteria bacterium]
MGPLRGRGRGARHSGRAPVADLRSLLHDEARRNRPWLVHQPRHRERARGAYRGRELDAGRRGAGRQDGHARAGPRASPGGRAVSQPRPGRVLVVDDEANITDAVRRALERVGYAVDVAADPDEAWARLERTVPDVVICDVRLHEADGLDVLARIRELYPEIAVIMMTGYASIESAVTSIKAGAVDYLAKPFNPGQLRHVVAKAIEQKRLLEENRYLRSQQGAADGVVIGESRAMRDLFETAEKVASTDSSVLIMGRSGTGKEVLARFIHASSPRRDRPFVTVNC